MKKIIIALALVVAASCAPPPGPAECPPEHCIVYVEAP